MIEKLECGQELLKYGPKFKKIDHLALSNFYSLRRQSVLFFHLKSYFKSYAEFILFNLIELKPNLERAKIDHNYKNIAPN